MWWTYLKEDASDMSNRQLEPEAFRSLSSGQTSFDPSSSCTQEAKHFLQFWSLFILDKTGRTPLVTVRAYFSVKVIKKIRPTNQWKFCNVFWKCWQSKIKVLTNMWSKERKEQKEMLSSVVNRIHLHQNKFTQRWTLNNLLRIEYMQTSLRFSLQQINSYQTNLKCLKRRLPGRCGSTA